MKPPVTVHRSEAVMTITLNRPERRNALTVELKEALRQAVASAADDSEVRAVVLAAAGMDFCVGQDLTEHAHALRGGAQTAFTTVREHYSPVVRDLMTMPKPVIAAVPGLCVGAGLGLALACDYRVFGDEVKLGTAFTGIGLTFDSGLSYTLPRAVGEARAKYLMLFGRMFGAAEAMAWGIAAEVVDCAEVLNHAIQLARVLAQGPTVAFAESKRLLLHTFQHPLEAALDQEAAAQARCGATNDHALATAAFLERQAAPTFAGN